MLRTSDITFVPTSNQQYKSKVDLYAVAYKRDDSNYDELLEVLQSKVKSLKNWLKAQVNH